MELIKNLGNTHMVRVLQPTLVHLDGTDKEILSAFLNLKFPGLIIHQDLIEVFKDVPESEIFLEDAYKTFKETMSGHVDKLGRNEILSLEELIDLHGLDDDDCFQQLSELISLIKERVSPEEIQKNIKENILDNLDIISNVLQINSRKTSKSAAIAALQRLSDICEKHPESLPFVSQQIAGYESHIKFIADEFCGEKANLSAEHLSLFEMTIRKYRISEN